MTASDAGAAAVALALDDPDELLAWLKQVTMERMDATAKLDVALAKRWFIVAEGIAKIETELLQ
jgi:hypothetical protein